jgi:hypothetical protein
MLIAIILAADLAIPLPKPDPRKMPEACVARGVVPFQGQMMWADKTCPSGYRWRYSK